MARAKRVAEPVRPQSHTDRQDQQLPGGDACPAIVQPAWKHPTGRQPKVISLIGLGPTHHDYQQAWLNPVTPPVIWQVDEVWTINRGLLTVPHDLAFVMDYITGEAEKNPVYGGKMWTHDKPIITSDTAEGWPAHVHAYPFGEVYSHLSALHPAPVHQEWCINSVVFMIWYAWHIGVTEIRCWGIDYHHHKSGRVEDGHPNVAYWVGRLEAEGLRVVPFDGSTFLDSDKRGFFYGYLQDPRPLAVSRRALFKRLAGLDPTPAEEDGNG